MSQKSGIYFNLRLTCELIHLNIQMQKWFLLMRQDEGDYIIIWSLTPSYDRLCVFFWPDATGHQPIRREVSVSGGYTPQRKTKAGTKRGQNGH